VARLHVDGRIAARRGSEAEHSELLERTQAAREEAEHANAAKDQFLAMLSHELRTPLSTLLMRSQMLRRGTPNDDAVHHAADMIERSTRLQVQLIDDLLDVSRIVAGKLTIDRRSIDFAGVVSAAIDNVSALAQAKKMKFVVDAEAGSRASSRTQSDCHRWSRIC
jgi:two-component system CheB/CheR fusion protein